MRAEARKMRNACRENTTARRQASQFNRKEGKPMRSRNRLARFAAAFALATLVAAGSQAFVPTAFGCSTGNSSDCRSASANKGGSETNWLVDQFRLVYELGYLLP